MGSGETTIGPYRVVRRLGVGGMAETFEAERVLSPTCTLEVCIKRVLPAFAEDAEYLALFRREAKLATSLRHSNVVGVVDAGDDHGQPYLVLELVDGIDLKALLATAPERRLPSSVVALIATDLAYALAYAHAPEASRPGLVHRDVSPSNVLLSRGGDVKLADFGVAKPMSGAVATQSGVVRGKIPYLAPEQMRGEHVDGRADLFSLGVMLYECLAGTRPFDGAHEVETMTRILADRRVPLLSIAPDVESKLAAIVERLLEADPDDRFADADALLDALDTLDPPSNARFLLLDLVEGRLGGPEARRHVRLGQKLAAPPIESREVTRPIRREREIDDASSSASGDDPSTHPLVEPTQTGLRPERVSAARPRWLAPSVVALAALGLVGLGVGLGSLRSGHAGAGEGSRTRARAQAALPAARAPASSARPESPPAARIAAAGLATGAPAPVPVDVASAALTSAMPSDSPHERARVRVVVLPWGKVWVDGVLRGRAPAVLTLEAGTHRIAAGQDTPSIERRVRLAEGEARTIELELDE